MPIPRISQYQHGSSLNPDSQDRSLELESELTEYSSSFFDDYDEEFEDDDSDIEEETSDDEFDDSTLWEIGNLLNSSDVPSRDSMLPPPRIIEDYDDEDSEEETEPMETPNRAPVVRFMPIQPLMPKSPIAAASEPESIAAPTAKPWPSQPLKFGIHTSQLPPILSEPSLVKMYLFQLLRPTIFG